MFRALLVLLAMTMAARAQSDPCAHWKGHAHYERCLTSEIDRQKESAAAFQHHHNAVAAWLARFGLDLKAKDVDITLEVRRREGYVFAAVFSRCARGFSADKNMEQLATDMERLARCLAREEEIERRLGNPIMGRMPKDAR